MPQIESAVYQPGPKPHNANPHIFSICFGSIAKRQNTNHTYDCLFKNRTRGLAEMDYDGSVVPIGKLMKYSTRKIINFLKVSFVHLQFLLRFFSSYFEFSIYYDSDYVVHRYKERTK